MTTESPIHCRLNGRSKKLPFSEAYRLFWAVHYAWLAVTDFYRWGVGGHAGWKHIRPLVQPKPRRLALILHGRGRRSLTIHDLEQIVCRKVEKAAFQAYAARFNCPVFGSTEDPDALPEDLRPFCYYPIDEMDKLDVPAYCTYPNRDYLVITWADADVDLSRFEEPPQAA